MQVIVPDDQLSVAIGKNGQNVRLAVKLTGWKIDVKSETMATSGEEGDAANADANNSMSAAERLFSGGLNDTAASRDEIP